ncbi:MAG: hypothetical protein JRG92_19180 [Deltaproteobacteria bacterium]|nr:hypothetical protein [Deltaproteobacteria bacterium]MBW2385761.1 hypothetical protein [Deltaproteobacteria bacterium]MBW2695502.1 hypothetical protein [Deltaproteobacteria bacterium]
MYDRKNEVNEFLGESIEDATAAAARFFGVEVDELKVVVPDLGEVSGATGRAVVVAVPKSLAGARPRRAERDGGRGEGRRERGGRRERPGRGERSDRGDRGDRGERSDRGERGERGGRGERVAAPRETRQAVESKGTSEGELGPVGEFVLGAVERLALGNFSLKVTDEDDFLVCQLRGDAAAALVSGDGRGIDALQLLANQVSRRVSEDGPRVVVDVEGAAENREDSLGKLAGRAAGRALDTGRAVALDPMNAHDRRIIHVELRDQDKIATMSIGEGRYRQVLVVPEGAPEYEEAAEASQASD